MNTLQRAADHGWPTLADANIPVDPAAYRLLPADSPGVAIATDGRVLEVVVDHIPTAAEIGTYERASGHQVAVTVTDPHTHAQLRARATAAGSGRTVPDLLADIGADCEKLTLHVGHAPTVTAATGIRTVDGWPSLSLSDVEAARDFLLGDAGDTATLHWHGTRWRTLATAVAGHPALTLRKVAGAPAALDALGLPADVADLTNLTSGFVVLASPPAGGRTTTLLAVLDRINAHHPVTITHLVDTDETPVNRRKAVVATRTLGDDVACVEAGVTDALLDGTQVLAVDTSELTPHDVEALLNAASAGLLVLVTVPAPDLTSALTQLLASAPESRRAAVAAKLAHSYACGVAQVLLPGTDQRRTPASEIWWTTPALETALRAGSYAQLAAAASHSRGRHPNTRLGDTLGALLAAGKITETVATRYGHRAARPLVTADDVDDRWVTADSGSRRRGKQADQKAARRTATRERDAATARELLDTRIDT